MDVKKEIAEHLQYVQEQKKTFGEGPWNSEPDREEFKHAGLDCLIQRNRWGVWCGYVGVPKGHPVYGKGYDDPKVEDISVHGGLTYSAECSGHICHVTEDADDKVHWFGFDCGHAGDYNPGMIENDKLVRKFMKEEGRSDLLSSLDVSVDLARMFHGVYRDQAYATEETKQLAVQLAAVS